MAGKIYDIAVVGAGPAGLSAALTGRIRNKEVALFERTGFSPKLQKAHIVENYPGLPGFSGQDLMTRLAEHCLAHQPALIKERVMNIFPAGDIFTILTPENTYETRTVILASGVVSTALFPGERDLVGKGVSYCATCDGMLYRDKRVAVISYAGEGEQEAAFLSEICNTVYYLPQYQTAGSLRAGVELRTDKPRAIEGRGEVTALVTEKEKLAVDGVFILRQSDPVENILPGLTLDGEVIKVGRDMTTNLPGVFAAGDCTGKPWQVAKAVGEGQVAVLSAINYLDKQP